MTVRYMHKYRHAREDCMELHGDRQTQIKYKYIWQSLRQKGILAHVMLTEGRQAIEHQR